jgi:hypothetical protein
VKRKIIISALIIIVFSCKKKGVNYVYGTVVDNLTNEPIAGAEVVLFNNRSIGQTFVLGRVYTDGYGRYKIDFNKIVSNEYVIKCVSNNYSNRLNATGTKLKHGKTAANFSLIPQGYLILRFIKGSYSNNIPQVRIGNFYGGYPQVIGSSYYQPYDVKSDSIVVDAYKSLEIEWHLLDIATGKPDSVKNFASVHVNKGDTIIYTISFN